MRPREDINQAIRMHVGLTQVEGVARLRRVRVGHIRDERAGRVRGRVDVGVRYGGGRGAHDHQLVRKGNHSLLK